MDFAFNEQLVARKLVARNLQGLFDQLVGLKGLCLNQRYTMRWLFAVGGQSILYLAKDPDGQEVIVKLAFLPYHRAAYISTDDILQARKRLERESYLLKLFRNTVLPGFYDLVYAANPLLAPARGAEIVDREPYLVMEFLQGSTLLEVARHTHRSTTPQHDALEWLAWRAAAATADFSISICRQEPAHLYVDLNPINMMLAHNVHRPVRLLDAGSLVPWVEDPSFSLPFNRAYAPVKYYEAYLQGQRLWPTPRYVLYTLGKTLWELLTNRQPYPGEDPDLSEAALKVYSHHLRRLVRHLLEQRYDSFEDLKREVESARALSKSAESSITALLPPSKVTPSKKPVSAKDLVSVKPTSPLAGPRLMAAHRVKLDVVQALRYSPNGQHIAVASRNRIELWEVPSLRRVTSLRPFHPESVVSLDFDASGRWLASGSRDGTLCVWDTRTGEAIWKHRHRSAEGQIALSGRGELLAAITRWGAVTYRLQLGTVLEHQFDGAAAEGCICVELAKKQSLLAVGGQWGIRLWQWETGKELGRLSDRSTAVWDIAISSDGQTIAGAVSTLEYEMQNYVALWNTHSRALLWQIHFPEQRVLGIRIGMHGRLLSAFGSSGDLCIWDLERKEELARLEGRGRISTIDFSPDVRTMASGNEDGTVQVYSLAEGK